MVFCLALAHIPSCFTENRHGRSDVNPVADCAHGFGPLTVGDTAGTAGAADRIRPSASGKIRSSPAPGQ